MELSDAEAGHDDVFESYESPRKKMKRHKGGSERIIIPRLNQVPTGRYVYICLTPLLASHLLDVQGTCWKISSLSNVYLH